MIFCANAPLLTYNVSFQFAIRYNILGENIKGPEAKKCRVKVRVKMEEYFGNGETVKDAKKHATLKV